MAKRVHPADRPADLERRVAALEKALATAIAWIALSAGSPLSIANAQYLLKLFDSEVR